MKNIYLLMLLVICTGMSLWVSKAGFCQQNNAPAEMPVNQTLTLVEAVMCETVKNLQPQHISVVFSVSTGSVVCFTAFDPVPEKMQISHQWYKKDRLITSQTLYLTPPRWSTYSKIYLRKEDKAPWHVKIIGPQGEVIQILRFSITD